MAETTKKATATTRKTSVAKTTTAKTTPKVDTSEIDVMKAQMEEMAKLIATLTGGVTTSPTMVSNPTETSDKYGSDDEIVVISQCVGHLSLSTGKHGQGDIYNFEEFCAIDDIPFGDLKLIVKANEFALNRGDFFIADEKAVKQLRLGNTYQRMLRNEDIMTLFTKDANTIVDLYKLAPEEQKENIITMVLDKIYKGEDIDANVRLALGKASGRDLLSVEKLEV